MSDTVEIGAARVRLIVDSSEMEAAIAQGKSAVAVFGTAAQTAYDRTERGTRRAADALLDYVAALGNADTQMTKYVRNASRMGVEKPVLDAAIAAWQQHNDEVELASQAQADNAENIKRTQAAYKELMSTQAQEEARLESIANAQAKQRFENLTQARAANSQQDFNRVLGVSEPSTDFQKRADAEAAFASIVEAENTALREQEQLVITIAEARQAQIATTAQQDFNKLLGIPEQQDALRLAQARKNAEAAFLPVLEEEAKLEQANSQIVGKQQAFLQELENIQATAGKTYYELLELRAAQLGLGSSAAPAIAQIKATNQAMGAGTISAKQYEFALRGLPAQFTDIVVSLQAGQSPFTVLLQQGGQIKDMFGGIGAAVSAVGQKLKVVVTNPWVLLAVAIAAVAAAAYKASSTVTELALATAKGNQVAGQAKNLNALAESLAGVDKNVSFSNAVAAVSDLASAGRLSGDNFKEAAQATARWASITGESVDTIAGKFNELARDPMAAVRDGTLRVTDAQYAELEALDRTGQKTKEVALAIKLYQDQVNNNSDSVLKNLSDAEKGWIHLKDAISDAIHELGVWTKNAAGTAFNVFNQKTNVVGMDEQGGLIWEADAVSAEDAAKRETAAAVQIAAAQQQALKLTPEQIAANETLQKSWDELGTKQQLFAQGLVKLNAEISAASPGELAAKNIQKSLSGALSGPGYQKLVEGLRLKIFGQGPDPTAEILAWEKTALSTFKSVQAAQDSFYANGQINAEQYYGNLLGLVNAEEKVQLQTIDREIKALSGRANSEDKIAALRQQRETVAQDAQKNRIELTQRETEAVKQRNLAYLNYVQQLADANIQLSRQGEQQAAAVGQGSREAALQQALANAKFQEALQERANNQKVGNQAGFTQADADRDNAAAAAALSTQLTILNGNYKNLSEAESDWLLGSKKAWAEWSETVNNYAAETGKVLTMTMDGFADAIAEAAVKGKLSFKSLIDSLIAEVVRFGIKIAEEKALQSVFNSYNGGSSSSGDYGTNFSGWATTIGKWLYSAKGNTFEGGSGLNAYRNSIVSQPTVFPFAKGGVPNVGVMGEKSGSPGEAIMPLTRTSGGELAVKATGNGQTKNNNVYQTFVVPGAVNRQTQDQLAQKSYGAASRAVRRNA